jgi:mono/diheme cytochrome c family protein
MRHRWLCALAVAALLMACERKPEQTQSAAPQPPASSATATTALTTLPTPTRDFSIQNLSRGAALYAEHCLQCHGPEGQGHPDWQTPSDGTFTAAPPLNGKGNDWKRSKTQLVAVIKQGAHRNGSPVMPAYQDRLSDDDIDNVLTWLQAFWPPEVYQRWLKANSSTTVPQG